MLSAGTKKLRKTKLEKNLSKGIRRDDLWAPPAKPFSLCCCWLFSAPVVSLICTKAADMDSQWILLSN